MSRTLKRLRVMKTNYRAMVAADTWHGPITVLSSDRRDWRVAPSTQSVPFEQGPSGIVCAASGLI